MESSQNDSDNATEYFQHSTNYGNILMTPSSSIEHKIQN